MRQDLSCSSGDNCDDVTRLKGIGRRVLADILRWDPETCIAPAPPSRHAGVCVRGTAGGATGRWDVYKNWDSCGEFLQFALSFELTESIGTGW